MATGGGKQPTFRTAHGAPPKRRVPPPFQGLAVWDVDSRTSGPPGPPSGHPLRGGDGCGVGIGQARSANPNGPEAPGERPVPGHRPAGHSGWHMHPKPSGAESAHGTYPPPFAQARPRSQKSRQNSGSTPTPVRLDKPVHARGTHNSKAQYLTAGPGMAMFTIQTNRMGLRCVVRCCDEQNAPSQT